MYIIYDVCRLQGTSSNLVGQWRTIICRFDVRCCCFVKKGINIYFYHNPQSAHCRARTSYRSAVSCNPQYVLRKIIYSLSSQTLLVGRPETNDGRQLHRVLSRVSQFRLCNFLISTVTTGHAEINIT